MKQICLYCQKEFETENFRVRSCSQECRKNHYKEYQRNYFKQPKWVEYMRIKNREKARINRKDPKKYKKMLEASKIWRSKNPDYYNIYKLNVLTNK